MRKYIDAEALKHKSIEIPFNGKFHKVIPLGEFDTIPAADVRPVVLCRDCKHRFNYPICAYRGDDWFCGYGEKREES